VQLSQRRVPGWQSQPWCCSGSRALHRPRCRLVGPGPTGAEAQPVWAELFILFNNQRKLRIRGTNLCTSHVSSARLKHYRLPGSKDLVMSLPGSGQAALKAKGLAATCYACGDGL